LRRDWRSGYDAPVLRQTAAQEDDIAVVIGVRYGPLVVETVQQLNNSASYGHLRLASRGGDGAEPVQGEASLGLGLAALLPDVEMRLTGSYAKRVPTNERSAWRESVFVGASYGEPQYRDNTSVFLRSRQIDLGMEWERGLGNAGHWLSGYVGAGVGWRDVALVGVGERGEDSSGSVDRAAVIASAGLLFMSGRPRGRWQVRGQLGLIGTLPVRDAELEFRGHSFELHSPGLNVSLGFVIDSSQAAEAF
jgi:hypothetical protein